MYVTKRGERHQVDIFLLIYLIAVTKDTLLSVKLFEIRKLCILMYLHCTKKLILFVEMSENRFTYFLRVTRYILLCVSYQCE
jgi:hypothetical protein